MPNVPRVGDLEIEQDLTYQRREWRVQRVGWAVMGLVVAAALLGLLGRGPLSDATAAAPDGSLTLEYHRFLHYHSAETLRLTAAAGTAEGGELRVWVAREFLAGVELQRVAPEPVRVEAGPDGDVLVIRVTDPGRPTAVTVYFEPDRPGSLPGRVGVVGRAAAAFRPFVYP